MLFVIGTCDDTEQSFTIEDNGTSWLVNTQIDTSGNGLTPNYDDADFYIPKGTGPYPVLFLHPGGKSDKQYYSLFAKKMAEAGVIVATTNHKSLFGQNFTEQKVLNIVWEFMLEKNGELDSPFAGLVDEENLFVLGHSFGGASVFFEAQQKCSIPTCLGFLKPPEALKAAIIYGSYTEGIVGGEIDNKYPFLYFQGELDDLDKAKATYNNIKNNPKMFVTIKGANHFGMNDLNNPPGNNPAEEVPEVDQETSVSAIAKYMSIFINKTVTDGTGAIQWISENEVLNDDIIEITSDY